MIEAVDPRIEMCPNKITQVVAIQSRIDRQSFQGGGESQY